VDLTRPGISRPRGRLFRTNHGAVHPSETTHGGFRGPMKWPPLRPCRRIAAALGGAVPRIILRQRSPHAEPGTGAKAGLAGVVAIPRDLSCAGSPISADLSAVARRKLRWRSSPGGVCHEATAGSVNPPPGSDRPEMFRFPSRTAAAENALIRASRSLCGGTECRPSRRR
jgi:hypothetical protein